MIYTLMYFLDDNASFSFEGMVFDFVIVIVGFTFLMEFKFMMNIIMALVFVATAIGIVWYYLTHGPLLDEPPR